MLPTYISNHNSTREKAIILLMIPNKERWHYFEVKELSPLSRGITSLWNCNANRKEQNIKIQ